MYGFYIQNIQKGEFQIAISGPDFLQDEIANIENQLPNSGTSERFNFPIFSSGVTELNKNQQISEISMYIDISETIKSPHDVAILTILNAMLTGVKGSLLGDRLRTRKQWVYNVVSYPLFYTSVCLLKLVTRTPVIYKDSVVKEFKENLVNIEDFKSIKLFDKAKKRVINELLMSCEIKKNEFLKTLCREKLFNIPSWDSITEEVEKVSLEELSYFVEKNLIQNDNFHIIIDC